MRKHLGTTLLSVIFSVAVFSPLSAASSGTSIFPFLKICSSARNAAMGESAAVMSAGSAVTNPAVLPWFDGMEFSFGHMAYLSEGGYSTVAGVVPLHEGSAAGFSAGYLGLRSMTRVVALGANNYQEQGNFRFDDAFISASYAEKLGDEFSVGVGIRGIQENIDSTSNSGVGVSAGGLYMPDHENYYATLSAFDYGPSVKGYDLPTGVSLGYGVFLMPQLLWALDGVYYTDSAAGMRTGVEYSIDSRCFLRGGYRYSFLDNQYGESMLSGVTVGLGFAFAHLILDYAWLPYGDLGDTHRMTLTYRLGAGPEGHARKRKKFISEF